MKDTLVIIPARGGSKGIPKKNIKLLEGKPLIQYSIDFALEFASAEDICVTTDDDEIIDVVKNTGMDVPFKRPASLAADTSGSYEVIMHAVEFYEGIGKKYSKVLLLQPTSPFRKHEDFYRMEELYNKDTDMVVSVGKSHHNPYFSLFEENREGFLERSKKGSFNRRQDCPEVYFYNGSIYLMSINSLKKMPLHQFTKVKKYVMDDLYCLDIDSPLDWLICETIIKSGIL